MKNNKKYLALFGGLILLAIAQPAYSAANKFLHQIIAAGGITSPNPDVTKTNSEEFGRGSVADVQALAVGNNATASGTASTAIGLATHAVSTESVVVGAFCSNSGPHDTVVGEGAQINATGGENILMGFGSVISNSAVGSVLLSSQGTMRGVHSVGIGYSGINVDGTDSIALGDSTSVGAGTSSSVVIGRGAHTLPDNIGYDICIGDNSHTGDQGSDSVVIGRNASANGDGAIDIGNTATSSTGADDMVCIGSNAHVSASHGIAIGTGASAVGESLAIAGHTTTVNSAQIGSNAGLGYDYFAVNGQLGALSQTLLVTSRVAFMPSNGDTGLFIPCKKGGVVDQCQLRFDVVTGVLSVTP